MRLCRVCLSADETNSFEYLFPDNCILAFQLFYVCGIKIIEISNHPTALICKNCITQLSSSTKFKKISLVADKYFRKFTREQEEFFYQEFKESQEFVEAKLESEDAYELIEYDDTIEGLAVEEWVEESLEVETVAQDKITIVEEYVQQPDDLEYLEPAKSPSMDLKEERETEKRVRKPYAPRQKGGARQAYQCECGITFPSNQRLQNHIRVKHEHVPESELLPCNICGKKFKIQEYLELHIRNQHSDNPIKQRQKNPCSICGKILSSLIALKNHEERHYLNLLPPEQVKKFFCDVCGQSFRMKSYLFNHMNNVHIRSKYSCNYCSRGFYKKQEMLDHVRQYHTMETPFQCDFEGCGKSFSRKKNHLIHMRIHTGEKPYSCTLCNKSFAHFIDRKRHLMKHTGERPHSCKVCSKGFMRKNELALHMSSHFA